MKKINIITLFLSLFAFSCKDFEEIKVIGIESFFLNKITADGIEAEVKVKIKNPNTVGFSIYPSTFDVTYTGIRLGKAHLSRRVHINANSEQIYTFKLKSKLSELNPIDALRLLNIDNIGKVEINGNLKVGKLYLRKKYPVNYTDKVNILK